MWAAKSDSELLGLSGSGSGRGGRALSLGGALVAGVVLALLFLPEFGAWVDAAQFFHHYH